MGESFHDGAFSTGTLTVSGTNTPQFTVRSDLTDSFTVSVASNGTVTIQSTGTTQLNGAFTVTGVLVASGALNANSGVNFSTAPLVNSATALTAGGKVALSIGAPSGVIAIYFGSGVPTASAPKGSLYLRSDGSSTSTRAYVNTDGGTTWTNLVTGA